MTQSAAAGAAKRFDPRLVATALGLAGLAFRIVRRRRVSLVELGEAVAGATALISYLRSRRR